MLISDYQLLTEISSQLGKITNCDYNNGKQKNKKNYVENSRNPDYYPLRRSPVFLVVVVVVVNCCCFCNKVNKFIVCAKVYF